MHLQELQEEKTIASMAPTNLKQKSAGTMGSRGSQTVTRSELKRAELRRAKSMGR